jgi:hypothetical protein
MKNLINRFLVIFVFLLFNSSFIYSQTIDYGEFMFVNKSNNQITVSIYPYGAIFNGNYQYNLYAANPINGLLYIYPTVPYTLDAFQTGTYFKKANFDRDEYRDGCDFSLGYGKYRIEINDYMHTIFSFDIDFSDADFCGVNPDYYRKIKINYNSYNDITYNFIANDGTTDFNPITITQENNTINVWELNGTPHQGWFTQNKGDFTEASDVSAFLTWPLIATGEYQALKHLNPEQYNLSLRIANHDITLSAYNSEIIAKFQNCKLTVDENRTLTVNCNQVTQPYILITGEGGQFISKNRSQIYLQKDCKFEIWDYAILNSYETFFYSNDPADQWTGIYFHNAGSSTLDNCTFNSLGLPIFIRDCGNNLITIQNNTFNEPYGNAIQIYFHYNVIIKNNHFWLGQTQQYFPNGICISTRANSEDENNTSAMVQNINIIDNDFHDGNCHLITDGIGTYLNVYIRGNLFLNANINIQLLLTDGSILNNSFNNQLTNGICINPMINSYPDLLNNYINSISNNLVISMSSEPNLAPNQINDQFVWTGGKNVLYSDNGKNIYSSWADLVYFYIENGRNSFDINNPSENHLWSKLSTDNTDYYSGANCWFINGTSVTPRCSTVLNSAYAPMIFHIGTTPPINCASWDDQIVDRIITNRGNGINDTILITQLNNVPPPSEDIALYSTGVKNQKLKNYSASILNFKNLINSYPNCKHLTKTIANLYENYVSSDTNHNQGWRNIIFGDLKNYLENKILQYDSNEAFINVAFDFLLRSKVKIKYYRQAMDGYEFIAENSPYSEERLIASLNYIDVEGLLQGSGGGQSENQDYTDELSSDRNGKPIKDILLASYNKTKKSIERKENMDIQSSNDVSRTKYELNRKHSSDKKLENKAKENISISSSLTKEERRKRIEKDLMLLTSRGEQSDKFVNANNKEPLKYELSQNYPNPFNPITNIKYQIQKTGQVTLKIYDITGREIKTLVNEIKNPGSYIVTFNGTELASGVYFYRIQAGDFVQVKKMVLIK